MRNRKPQPALGKPTSSTGLLHPINAAQAYFSLAFITQRSIGLLPVSPVCLRDRSTLGSSPLTKSDPTKTCSFPTAAPLAPPSFFFPLEDKAAQKVRISGLFQHSSLVPGSSAFKHCGFPFLNASRALETVCRKTRQTELLQNLPMLPTSSSPLAHYSALTAQRNPWQLYFRSSSAREKTLRK